jgi:hypothetical protein
MHNPGALGILHMGKIISIAVPTSHDIGPEYFSESESKLRSYCLSAGISRDIITQRKNRLDWSAALGYGRVTADNGTVVFTDANGNPIGTSDAYERTQYYAAAIGIDYHVRIGIGITAARFYDNIEHWKENETNIGIIAEIPIADFFDHSTNSDSLRGQIKFEFTPTIAAVTAIENKFVEIGVSPMAAISFGGHKLFAARYAYERGISTRHHSTETYNDGFEFTVFNALSLRLGSFKEDKYLERTGTWGFGVSLAGIIEWWRYGSRSSEISSPTLRYLVNHLDLTYDYAKISDEQMDKISFMRINISM